MSEEKDNEKDGIDNFFDIADKWADKIVGGLSRVSTPEKEDDAEAERLRLRRNQVGGEKDGVIDAEFTDKPAMAIGFTVKRGEYVYHLYRRVGSAAVCGCGEETQWFNPVKMEEKLIAVVMCFPCLERVIDFSYRAQLVRGERP